MSVTWARRRSSVHLPLRILIVSEPSHKWGVEVVEQRDVRLHLGNVLFITRDAKERWFERMQFLELP